MIVGSITQDNVARFLARTPALRGALEFIRTLPADPPDGITELDGRDLYVNVHRYDTRPRDTCTWESHRHTADVQYVFGGGELIDWSPAEPGDPSVAYDASRDFESWLPTVAAAQTVTMSPGTFAIFLPGELHRPMIADGRDAAVRKLVVKIHARFLEPD